MEHVDVAQAKVAKLRQIYQHYVDQSVPYVGYRWGALGTLLFLFVVRILTTHGWYIICYGLGIYLLSLLLAFLTPRIDPGLEQEIQDEQMEEGLPVSQSDEFRPFIRRLPEFKFWNKAIIAVTISLVMSLFSVFDVPVFWPILVFYFVTLLVLTMRRQIQHMIKYKYIPFDIGKKKFRST